MSDDHGTREEGFCRNCCYSSLWDDFLTEGEKQDGYPACPECQSDDVEMTGEEE